MNNSKRSYYSNYSNEFLKDSNEEILGKLTSAHSFELDVNQRNAWISEIIIMKDLCKEFPNSFISFEFIIPRMGLRCDVIFITKGIIFAIEFKIGEGIYLSSDRKQVDDYALDLKNFHKGSHNKVIVPILYITENKNNELSDFIKSEDQVYIPINANNLNINKIINKIINSENQNEFDYFEWQDKPYQPTPTIIEAAKVLYKGHNVVDLTRSEGDIKNLSTTTLNTLEIIKKSRRDNQKSICFITGVPGAGKTLAGLDIVHKVTNELPETRSVYLSGNLPLIEVLRQALARDRASSNDENKSEAIRKVKQFIQPIHHFRNEYVSSTQKADEKITIFDEAQRCWNEKKLTQWMKKKTGITIKKSEPESLIEIMNRHDDWCVIICLVGGGQEIHDGEAGLKEWFSSTINKFQDWKIYLPSQIKSMSEYNLNEILDNYPEEDTKIQINDNLHLGVSARSFRSELVSEFINNIINLDINKAINNLNLINNKYPIFLTRDLEKAKSWIRSKKRGSERYGILASSDAKRLKPFGINVDDNVQIDSWFLENEENDLRSSNFLEYAVTEFSVQGLELDWSIVGWDADFSFIDNNWYKRKFRGHKWVNINTEEGSNYKSNAYRVLLTRARQGMIIFLPEGDDNDYSRQKKYYDGTFKLLQDIGLKII